MLTNCGRRSSPAAEGAGWSRRSHQALRDILRWVPDWVPLALHPSGKGAEDQAPGTPPLSREHGASAECCPGPSAPVAAKRLPLGSNDAGDPACRASLRVEPPSPPARGVLGAAVSRSKVNLLIY